MRTNYKTTNELTLLQQKQYLLQVCQDQDLEYILCQCMNHKQLQKIMNNPTIKQQLFSDAKDALYQSKDYETLEEQIVMMNSLFDNQEYNDIKEELLNKICHKEITIQEYCVLRQLIHFNAFSFDQLIYQLHTKYHVSSIECAKICLLEDQHQLAVIYLKQLELCEDEKVLDLLCSYSISEYISLMKYYKKKEKSFVLLPTH